MFATVELPTTFSRTAVNVPASAIQQIEGKNVVFIRNAPTVFEVREVQLGKQIREQVEIVAGLKENEAVVTQGSFHLKSVLAGKGLGEDH
jgi:cobalt-zinc-cadmium efflux system membrane fusion protein